MPRKGFPGKKMKRVRPEELRVTSVSLPEAWERTCLPLYLSRVPAGFPSPAGAYVESNIDLNEWLVGVQLRKLFRGAIRSWVVLHYAAITNRFSTNFACPTASVPSSLLTCPFLIMCMASIPSIVRSAV